jgi:hypothetical protein
MTPDGGRILVSSVKLPAYSVQLCARLIAFSERLPTDDSNLIESGFSVDVPHWLPGVTKQGL